MTGKRIKTISGPGRLQGVLRVNVFRARDLIKADQVDQVDHLAGTYPGLEVWDWDRCSLELSGVVAEERRSWQPQFIKIPPSPPIRTVMVVSEPESRIW